MILFKLFFLVSLILLFECKVCIYDRCIDGKINCDLPKQNDDMTQDWSDNVAAWAFYENNINMTGWAHLELTTNPNLSDSDQAYAAGYLEAALSWELIDMHWYNVVDGRYKHLKQIDEFIQTNNRFINEMTNRNPNDPYWHQVFLVYKQIQGMQDGYDGNAQSDMKVNLLWLNLVGELKDIDNLFIGEITHYERCSVLIKPLADASDLYVGHNSWYYYSAMIRVIKKYNFSYHQTSYRNSALVSSPIQAFTSYPGLIHSFDDFYITSTQMVVVETTNSNFNKTSAKAFFKPEKILFEFVRNVVANRLTTNGEHWTEMYTRYTSGTYNNQFMIVDYKKFTPGMSVKQLPDGLLWLVETMPGLAHAEDVTHVLRQQGYWASYNNAFFEDIRQISSVNLIEKKNGVYYSHENSPRARIIRREQEKVKDMQSFYYFMEYNDYQHDPLSLCSTYGYNCSPPYSAKFAISGRQDLIDPNGIYPSFLKSNLYGSYDVKMTNYEMMKHLSMYAESGPTRTQQPAFQWSKVNKKLLEIAPIKRHMGHPDKWEFPTLKIDWSITEKFQKIEF